MMAEPPELIVFIALTGRYLNRIAALAALARGSVDGEQSA